jgi:tellurite resistance protein TerC
MVFVVAMLAIDLGIFQRRPHEVTLKEAAVWSSIWVALAGLFGGLIYMWFGASRATEYATGYLVEKALAVDNIFVFVVLFQAFAVPRALQHRVLFWGVLGALALRAVFIFGGAALLERFHGLTYVFGAFLAFTGIKLLRDRGRATTPQHNPLVRFFGKLMPVSNDFEGEAFTVKRAGRLYATPLLVALIAVEVTDLLFAVDSIPAVFAITRDPFLVFTSNIFAILGLRSMYFLLAAVVMKLTYLKVGLSLVLVFVGAKMLLSDLVKLPNLASLGVIAAILSLSVALSLWRPQKAAEIGT